MLKATVILPSVNTCIQHWLLIRCMRALTGLNNKYAGEQFTFLEIKPSFLTLSAFMAVRIHFSGRNANSLRWL